MPRFYDNGLILPEKFDVPESLVYQYMIWSLAKYYKLSPHETGRMKEIDFWQMKAFEDMEQAKTDYIMKLRSGS